VNYALHGSLDYTASRQTVKTDPPPLLRKRGVGEGRGAVFLEYLGGTEGREEQFQEKVPTGIDRLVVERQ